MKYDKKTGIIIFAVLVLLVLVNSLYITPLTISDTDPSTYAIVPLLMLPLFVIFYAKADIIPEIRRNDIIIGASFFAAYALATIYLKLALQYIFIDMSVDLLLVPLLLLSMISFLFGTRNIGKFKAILVYSIFASPAVLLFIYPLNFNFAVANTVAIYTILKPFVAGLVYSPPITLLLNGNSVGIGETCVGIGILIALIFFLIPLAYMYNGKIKKKIIWIATAFFLLLILNFLRMLLISLAWLVNGPSDALLTIHLFVGILLFYIIIIAMVLLSGRFGLAMPFGSSKKKSKKTTAKSGAFEYGIAAAILVAICAYLLSLNYINAVTVSPAALATHSVLNGSNGVLDPLINNITNTKGYTSVTERLTNGTVTVITMSNSSSKSSPSLLIALSSTASSLDNVAIRSNLIYGGLSYLDNRSVVEHMYYVETQGTFYYIYDKLVPYAYPNQTSSILDVYVALPASLVTNSSSDCPSYYNSFYSNAFNIFQSAFYNPVETARITSAYCKITRLVG